MYSGFITAQRTVPAVGTHQRLDIAAYRLVSPYFTGMAFPLLKEILHFEGLNGPDGLKVKSPGHHDPGHLYNPQTDCGEIPELIHNHYTGLVGALRHGDRVRAAFEAAWLAHYVCDGLTPAHHFPLDELVAEQKSVQPRRRKRSKYKHTIIVPGDTAMDAMKRSWALWGRKGLLTTHFSFEIGVATALIGHKVKAGINASQLRQAQSLGPVDFFKQEARAVAGLRMYEEFYVRGWNARLARLVKTRLAPKIVETVATIWWLAAQEAGAASVTVELEDLNAHPLKNQLTGRTG